MTESEIRDIVARVLAAMGSAHAGQAARPRALVLFTGALLGFEHAIQSLQRLRSHVDLFWTQTPSAARVLDQTRIQSLDMDLASQSLSQDHDFLIVPTLTVNVAAKTAHGIGDCLGSNAIAQFIMMGRPVVAALDGVCPDSAAKREWFPNMPIAYQQMLRGTLTTLRSMGVTFTPAELLAEATLQQLSLKPAEGPQPLALVTEATVAETTPGTSIVLAPRAIVTDLARELAREHNITLEQRS